MKVLQITTSSKGGAGIAALRLHHALRENGVSSGFLSQDLSIDFEGTKVEDSFFEYKKLSVFQRIIRKVQIVFSPTKAQRVQKEIKAKKAVLEYEMLSVPFSSYQLEKHPLVQEATLLNLHWVGIILDYERFFLALKKPIVWTLHDMNPFLGLFHYRADDLKNSMLLPQLDAECRKIKRAAIQNISMGAVITPSNWLLNEALESEVFNHFSVKRRISNAIDLETFKLQDSTALRKEYGIDPNEFVLLFISDRLANKRKGFDLLLEALTHLDETPITVVTIGKGETKSVCKNLKIVPLGRIASPAKMAACYALADLFVLPSREDNLPNVLLESFACGTPAVGFSIGGMKEHIRDDFNGYLAKEISGASLAKAIECVCKNRNSYDRSKIRAFAEDHFNFKKQAKAYTSTYRELIK